MDYYFLTTFLVLVNQIFQALSYVERLSIVICYIIIISIAIYTPIIPSFHQVPEELAVSGVALHQHSHDCLEL